MTISVFFAHSHRVGHPWGKKISAKQLKTYVGRDSSCANALCFTSFQLTSAQNEILLPPILNKPDWAR
ncbi:hypothetical protein [Serratia rhizosphaerae]|uniref:Uncharacterized protein n=1 Tax=Serratia rhizosphaerae TaxID=2597702 RepID=A0ABX6GSK1_9GAMM|nr:hypothetical protein [Serratia rhizosphaerae]QHA89215.1 hypothetical protein FO014_20730 [Serratia rhizosphaerae]